MISLKQHLAHVDIDHCSEISGIDKDQIEEAAAILKDKKKIIACWAMGLTQHKNAVDTIKEVVKPVIAERQYRQVRSRYLPCAGT
jgi:anaerobic selenocysteine-containing dehydrogenase